VTKLSTLPIQEIVPKLLEHIATSDCILSAPPGAGKSTYLPLQLLSLPCFSEQQILLLQPRQVAVRSIANYLASQLNEKVGETIGYQMRGESSFSVNTRLLVITEGLLIAKLQADPELSKVGLIIFDEFHERSVQSDLALGLSIEVQSGLRDDLRCLVMSATLHLDDLKRLMPHAKVMFSEVIY
jgi:ATP-dependent helicase HrpB